MHRRGALLADLMLAISVLAVLMSLTTAAVRERMQMRTTMAAASELEIAQNLLSDERRGLTPELPAGWSIAKRPVGSHCIRITITGHAVSLSTLVSGRGGR